jgi:hypothetical protein
MGKSVDNFDYDEELDRTYESVRAAHRKALQIPEQLEPSGIDWARLEDTSLRTGPLQRLEIIVRRVPSGTLAGSMAIPTLIVATVIIFIGTHTFTSFAVAALVLLGSFLTLGICGLWAFVAFEAATDASVRDRPFFRRVASGSVYAVLIAAVTIGSFIWTRKPIQAQTAFANGAVALAQRRYTVALQRFAAASLMPGEDASFFIAIGDILHQNCMMLDSDVPKERAAQLDLATAALGYYQRAGELASRSTAVKIRMAELDFIRGNIPAAEQKVRQIAENPAAPQPDRIKATELEAAIFESQAAELQRAQATTDITSGLKGKIALVVEKAAELDRSSNSADSSAVLSRLLMTEALISPPSDRESLTNRAVVAANNVLARGGRSVGQSF